jgi:hypothetical protein
MDIETLITYALRLWLAGAVHVGVALAQAGPFILAGLGFAGWLISTHEDDGGRKERTMRDVPAFTLR